MRKTIFSITLAAALCMLASSYTYAQAVSALNDPNKTMNLAGDDADFLKNSIDDANAERVLSIEAKDKATDPEVKAQADKLVTASSLALKQLIAYAPSLGVKLPKELPSKYKKEQAQLKATSGADYDRLYVKDMVGLHHDYIETLASEKTGNHDTTYQTVAGNLLTAEEAHSATLKELQVKTGK